MEDRTLRRSCPMARIYFPDRLWDWIYVEAIHYVEIVPLAQNSPFGTSFRWDLEGWLNPIVDSNQAIDSTLQVDLTIGFDLPSGLIRLRGLIRFLGFDSTNLLVGSSPRIDSTPRI